MDELAAAAAVLAMDVDSNADEAEAQEETCGGQAADHGRPPAREPRAADKENERAAPESRGLETDKEKVWTLPKIPPFAPCARSLTRCRHPTDLPWPLPLRRWKKLHCCGAAISCSPRVSDTGGLHPRLVRLPR